MAIQAAVCTVQAFDCVGSVNHFPYVRGKLKNQSGQISHTQWYDLFPDPMIADAIMDRIIHNSYILGFDSKLSMREVMAERLIKNIEKNSSLA